MTEADYQAEHKRLHFELAAIYDKIAAGDQSVTEDLRAKAKVLSDEVAALILRHRGPRFVNGKQGL